MDEKILVTKSSMPSYEDYIEAIKPLWDTHWLTNMGIYHSELEEKLKSYLGVPELSLMVNGHMALEMTIQAFGFPEGSEIITTPFTFISTTHAIVRNHLKPVFCDVKEEDGTIDESKIEELITERTVAILPVHVYGNVCNVEAIEYIANKYNLRVIYDAAHAFGVVYKGKGIGNYGDASVFSFHATKVYNTIEGGAVTFKDHRIYEKLYNLKNFGIRGEEIVCEVGANAKMNEFSAIMGLCNLKHIQHAMEERRKRHDFYQKCLQNAEGIHFFEGSQDANKNYAYFPVIFHEKIFGSSRNEVSEALQSHGIFARKYFFPLTNTFECYHDRYDAFLTPNALYISKRVLTLPIYPELSMEDIDRICEILLSCRK